MDPRRRRPTLLLLNGLPGGGKSTVSAAVAARRPGTLNLDIDVVRGLISRDAGDPASTAGPARALGLARAAEHLRGGSDVVVPQLVARPDQAARFERAARDADAVFVHVVLEASWATVASRQTGDAAAHRQGLDAPAMAAYGEGLRAVVDGPGVVVLGTDGVEVHDVVAHVGRLLEG